MPFQKNNQYKAQKFLERPLDTNPVTFKGYKGQREALKSVPNWQEHLREYVDKLIEESKLTGG